MIADPVPVPRLMNSVPTRKQLADDPDRLDALITSMSKFLARCLTLKDPDMLREDLHLVRNAKACGKEWAAAPPLGEVMDSEIRYMPDREQLDMIEELADSYDFARESEALAERMLSAACGTGVEYDSGHSDDSDEPSESTIANMPQIGGVVISVFADASAYFKREEFTRPDKDTITVGGIARQLRLDLYEHAREWLLKCDRTLCQVYDEPWGNSELINSLVDTIAMAISKKMTLHGGVAPRSDSMAVEVDHLSPTYLGSCVDACIAQTSAATEVEARNDLRSIQLLNILARDGGGSQAAVTVLTKQLALVRRVVERAPPELGLVGENAKRMNFAMLRKVLQPDMPLECRIAITSHWSACHGAYAQNAIAEAVRRLEHFSPKTTNRFVSVVSCTVRLAGRRTGTVVMPTASFAPSSTIWFALPAPTGASTRLAVGEPEGRRLVRLSSMVWEMMAHGAFEKGVIASEIVAPVALEALNQARLMREIVDHERSRANLGMRILSFSESINDRRSELAHEIDKAMCELSAFSLSDVFEAFHPKQELINHVVTPLRVRMIDELGNKGRPLVDPSYRKVAAHSLALLLPAIELRRRALYASPYSTPNPLADLVRTMKEVHDWSPLDGRFTADQFLLKRAHPLLREALEHYSREESGFVKATGVRKDASEEASRSHRKVTFTFESSALLKLLRM